MMKWFGMLANILGAFFCAFGIMLVGYTAFMLGSVIWVYVGLGSRDKPLTLQSFIFGIANIVGFYRAII